MISLLSPTPAHCHAPSCIREEIWNADTGQIICNVSVMYGSEVWGPGQKNVFNEANYVAIPPCIFGNQSGIQDPWAITPDTNITAIKYFNNTFRHLGQMAQWTGMMVRDIKRGRGAERVRVGRQRGERGGERVRGREGERARGLHREM